MAGTHSRNGWIVWLTFAIGLLLSVSPLPQFMEILRPLWLALLLAFWALALPHKVGMVTAMCLGLMEDVLYGTLLGQNALILTLITFLVLSLQQRLRMFPMWQQCLVILVIFGLAQLVQLWLSALTGNRQPTLALVLPALVSALLWPWVSLACVDCVVAIKSIEWIARLCLVIEPYRESLHEFALSGLGLPEAA